jgi:hypothetical protein
MLDSLIHLADEALTAIALLLTIGEKLVPIGRRLAISLKKSLHLPLRNTSSYVRSFPVSFLKNTFALDMSQR